MLFDLAGGMVSGFDPKLSSFCGYVGNAVRAKTRLANLPYLLRRSDYHEARRPWVFQIAPNTVKVIG